MQITRNYRVEPTAKRFHQAGKQPGVYFRGVRGVPSSGKSVMCLQECLQVALDQWPYQGVRKTRFLVARATYPSLNMTTMKTVEQWFPEEIWPIRKTTPASQMIKFSLDDGTKVEMELVFLALEGEEDIKKLKSLELTGAWLNEVFEMNRAIVTTAFERTGRYPAVMNDEYGNRIPGTGCKRRGVWMDTNSPPETHWYKEDEENPPEGWQFFVQPPPLIRLTEKTNDGRIKTIGWENNPLAENIRNLTDGYKYYRAQLPGMKEHEIAVNIENKFGSVFKGKSVYGEEWIDDMAVTWDSYDDPLGGEIIVGIDTTGLNPGAVVLMVEGGTVWQTDELIGEDIAFESYCDNVLVPHLRTRYAGANIICVCDPANPRDARIGETPIQTLARKGLKAVPAATNNLKPRIESVVHFLQKRNGYRVTRNCSITIAGFQGGYRYPKLKVSGSESLYGDKPVKDKFSTAHDGLQYACLYIRRGNRAETDNDKAGWQKKAQAARRTRKWA